MDDEQIAATVRREIDLQMEAQRLRNHPAMQRRCKVCKAQPGEQCQGVEIGSAHMGRFGFLYRLGVAGERGAEVNSRQGY